MRTLPKHTMNSGAYGGPLAVPPGVRLIRAGGGVVELWNLDGLLTHGENGGEPIGTELDMTDSWHDDAQEVEPSPGTCTDTAAMICAVDPKKTGVGVGARAWEEYSFSTSVVDLEGGGRSVQWFVGHGGELDGITTDPVGHPNVFMTACSDGYVRLFNVRLPLPPMMINSGVGKDVQQ